MPRLAIARAIDAPVSQVWEIFTDIEGAEQRLSAVEQIELLSSEPFAVGTRWRETRTLYGKSATAEMRISALELHRFYTVEAGATSTRYTSRFDFRSVNPSTTEVTFTFSAESRGKRAAVSKVFWPLIKGRMAKDLRRDLDDLAAVCERE